MNDYNDECPKCGWRIYLTFFQATCNISVHVDGWSLTDGPCDTSEEDFHCKYCGQVPSDFVFKRMSKKKAIKMMDDQNLQRSFTRT